MICTARTKPVWNLVLIIRNLQKNICDLCPSVSTYVVYFYLAILANLMLYIRLGLKKQSMIIIPKLTAKWSVPSKLLYYFKAIIDSLNSAEDFLSQSDFSPFLFSSMNKVSLLSPPRFSQSCPVNLVMN